LRFPPAIAALQASPAFPSELVGSLKQWFRDYTGWMLTSKNGNDEATAKEQSRGGLLVEVACSQSSRAMMRA